MQGDVVGWIIGALGLLATALIAFLSRRPKRLQYLTLVDQQIMRTDQFFEPGQFTVRFQGDDLVDPRVVIIRVINTGKQELSADASEEPITISHVGDGQLVAVGCRLGGRDDDVELDGNFQENGSYAAPKKLLNRGEWIEFNAIADGLNAPLKVSVRAAGVTLTKLAVNEKKGDNSKSDREWPWLRAITLTFVSIFILLLTIWLLATFFSSLTEVKVPKVVGLQVDKAIRTLDVDGFTSVSAQKVRSSEPLDTVILQVPGPSDYSQ